jgi:hypothetical protein
MTEAQYRSYLTGKSRCSICAQPAPLHTFQLIERPVEQLDWTDIRAFCAQCVLTAQALIAESAVEFPNENHQSRYAILKAAIKRRRFGNPNISAKEIRELHAGNCDDPANLPDRLSARPRTGCR